MAALINPDSAMKTPCLIDRLAAVALLAACSAFPAAAGQVDVLVQPPGGPPTPNVAVTVQQVGLAPPRTQAGVAVMRQRNLRFEPALMVLPVGSTLRFTNEDKYDHHVRSQPGGPAGNVAPARNFEFRLPPPAGDKVSSADVMLDAPGVITVGCHIHGSMRGHVLVSATPWVGVTDAQGRVSISGVPEGEVEVRVWHPEQLVDQPVQRVQVGSGVVTVSAPLNFRPSTRRAASAADPYGKTYN